MIGTAVHYVSHGTPIREDGTQAYPAKCRAATVTEVTEDWENGYGSDMHKVGLCVLNPTGLFFRSLADGGSEHSQLGTPGSWHAIAECEIVHAQPTYGKAV